MVLTDENFGRAYLTEGWARRFLVDLFRSYPVLFVGYSHSDLVMTYLARALPPGTSERFALTDDPDKDEWRLLGIEPIGYAKPVSNDHSALERGVKGLAKYARRSVLDWQRKVVEIASNPPSLDDEAADLVRDALPSFTPDGTGRHPPRARPVPGGRRAILLQAMGRPRRERQAHRA